MGKIIERFDAYMATVGLNDNKVTIQLNLSKGLIGKSRGEGRDLSRSLTEKILAYYTDLNEVWLLTGEGPMLKSDQPENPMEEQPSSNSSLIDYLQRKVAELEGKIDKLNEEKADLLQENAVLKYENQLLAPQKGRNAEDAESSLSVSAAR